MKRTVLFFLLAICAIAIAPAQHWGPGNYLRSRDFSRAPRAESVSVSGELTIVQGMIAINSGGFTYITAGLHRFVGFIDGFKEGASVSLEGNAYPLPQNDSHKYLQVQKMTFNGREYDLSLPRQNPRAQTIPAPAAEPRRGSDRRYAPPAPMPSQRQRMHHPQYQGRRR